MKICENNISLTIREVFFVPENYLSTDSFFLGQTAGFIFEPRYGLEIKRQGTGKFKLILSVSGSIKYLIIKIKRSKFISANFNFK